MQRGGTSICLKRTSSSSERRQRRSTERRQPASCARWRTSRGRWMSGSQVRNPSENLTWKWNHHGCIQEHQSSVTFLSVTWMSLPFARQKNTLCSKFGCHPRGCSRGFAGCVGLLSDVEWYGPSEGSRTSCCAPANETLQSLQRSGMYCITALLVAAVFTRTLWTLHILHSGGSFLDEFLVY